MTNRWNATEYDAKHAFVYEKAKGLVELLAPKAGERILDLGCGTGALTAEIAARGAEVWGVDRSEEMIAQARKKFPALRFEVMDARNLRLELLSLEEPGMPRAAKKSDSKAAVLQTIRDNNMRTSADKVSKADETGWNDNATESRASSAGATSGVDEAARGTAGQFDAVFSNAVLHWIAEAEQVIAGVARALKPRGRFVAEFGGKGNIQKLVRGFQRAFAALGMRAPDGVSPWFYPSVAEYAEMLEKHGLEVREASLFDRPTALEEGERGLENWIRLFRQTFLEKMGEANAQRWIREVERQCRGELFQDGSWVLDYRRLRIAAWKA